jgi:hypothetical protein
MQEQLPRVAMLGLEKSVRNPENTALKAPASKNLCTARGNFNYCHFAVLWFFPTVAKNSLHCALAPTRWS